MSAKVLKKCQDLIDIGNGLASRIFYYGTHIPDNILSDTSLSRILQRIERKFPDIKNLEKSSGYEVFAEKANEITSSLKPLDYLLRDVHDYNLLSIECLKELISIVPEFDFIIAPNYCNMFCTMYVLHINIYTTLSRISEAKLLYGLYASAYGVMNGGKPHPNYMNMVQLFENLEDRNRFIINIFSPFQRTVKDILLQFYDSIVAGNDIMTIRKEGSLNPLRSGESMVSI